MYMYTKVHTDMLPRTRLSEVRMTECMCEKPFDSENARAKDEDTPCKNGEN